MAQDSSREDELLELRLSPRAKDRVLAAIYERQTSLGSRVTAIEQDTSSMRRALHGDPQNKQPGIVDLTHRNHNRIKRLERLVTIGTGVLATVAFFWDAFKAKVFGLH